MADDEMEEDQLEPLEIVSRDDWGAAPAKEAGTPLALPLSQAIITYSTETETCEEPEECVANMKELQKKHMEEQGMSDIMYNFVVGGDGKVYEGRGWSSQPSNPKYPEHDGKRLDIAYMGVEDRENLPWEMFKPCVQLLQDEGVKNNYLDPEFVTLEDPPPPPEDEDGA